MSRQLILLDKFLDIISAKCSENIKKLGEQEIQIDVNLLCHYFNKFCPNNQYLNTGYFMRAVVCKTKKKHNIATLCTKIKRVRHSFIILYSDNKNQDSDQKPLIISEINDIRVNFISDILQESDTTMVQDEKSDMTASPTGVMQSPSPHRKVVHPPSSHPPSSHPPSNQPPSIQPPSNQPCIHEPSTTKFPLLHSLGIETNFDTKNNTTIIETLLAEVVALHNSSGKQLRFVHVGNNKPAMLVSIPRAKNYRTYEKNERREKWLDSILKFVAKSNKDDTSPSTVCSWLLQDIHKYYPSVFVEIAVQSGLHVIHKMTAVEAAAMWIDANIRQS